MATSDSIHSSGGKGRHIGLFFDELPREDPLAHQGALWWKMATSRLIGAGLWVVANGGIHPDRATIIDIPLDDFPELPAEHPHFEKRKMERTKIFVDNERNQAKRLGIQLGAWDVIYSAALECTAAKAPMLHEELQARCPLYEEDGVEFQSPLSAHFDGPLAARCLKHVCIGSSRTDSDKDFYRDALALQRANPLPDGCAASDYDLRALAFVTKINPHLSQQYSAPDVGAYLIKLMPAMLRAEGRRLKREMEGGGSIADAMRVAAACRALVLEEQRKPAPAKALAVLDARLFDHEPALFTSVTGLEFRIGSTGLQETAAAATDASQRPGGNWASTKFCPKCPHRSGCYSDPSNDKPWAPVVWQDAARKRAIMETRDRWAADPAFPGPGNRPVAVKPPSRESIAKAKERKANWEKKKAEKEKEGTPGGLMAPAGGLDSVEEWYSGLQEINPGAVSISSLDSTVAVPGPDTDGVSLPGAEDDGVWWRLTRRYDSVADWQLTTPTVIMTTPTVITAMTITGARR